MFKQGEKLPSLRTLAALHGYAKNTVVSSFERLVARSLVEPRRGAGYFVKAASSVAQGADNRDETTGSPGRAMDIVWMMREQFKTVPDAVAVGDGFPPVE